MRQCRAENLDQQKKKTQAKGLYKLSAVLALPMSSPL